MNNFLVIVSDLGFVGVLLLIVFFVAVRKALSDLRKHFRERKIYRPSRKR